MKRFDCLKIAAEELGDALVITTVGGAAAEWNALRPGDGNLRCRTLGCPRESPWKRSILRNWIRPTIQHADGLCISGVS